MSKPVVDSSNEGLLTPRKKDDVTNQPTALKASDSSAEDKRKACISIKNRRRMYLERHPSYFESPELELADPLLYDRCVRRFQSASEREAEGRSKGYSGVLEADLYRSEAKLAALENQKIPSSSCTGPWLCETTYARGPQGQVLPEDIAEIPVDREDGMSRWKHEMTNRFVNGEDGEFSYKDIDESEIWDIIEQREAEDEWFEDEEPHWIGGQDSRCGETGIQDF